MNLGSSNAQYQHTMYNINVQCTLYIRWLSVSCSTGRQRILPLPSPPKKRTTPKFCNNSHDSARLSTCVKKAMATKMLLRFLGSFSSSSRLQSFPKRRQEYKVIFFFCLFKFQQIVSSLFCKLSIFYIIFFDPWNSKREKSITAWGCVDPFYVVLNRFDAPSKSSPTLRTKVK